MDKMNKNAMIDRDLSWLKFNKRVAEEGAKKNSPVFDRLKFMSIYSSNIAEFYMVRVGAQLEMLKKKGISEKQEKRLRTLLSAIKEMQASNDEYAVKTLEDIFSEFAKMGYTFKKREDITSDLDKEIREYMKTAVIPLLSPMILGKNDSFPHFANGSIFLVSEFEKGEKQFFGICELPKNAAPLYFSKSEKACDIFFLEDLLLEYADKVFDGLKIKRSAILTLSRNADIDIDEETESVNDYRRMLSFLIELRAKLFPVRLLYKGSFKGALMEFILKRTKFEGDHIFESKLPFSFKFVENLKNFMFLVSKMSVEEKKKLESPKFKPKESLKYQSASMIEWVRKEDIFFSFPHDSMKPLIRFVEECAKNPSVAEIKMTIYRTNENSQLVEALINASESGKKVTVIVELKARFDEKHNIDVSRQLQQAGCIVSFGKSFFKVHSKLLSIKFENGTYMSYVGTGNFHEGTAKQYTDLGILTADTEIGEDVSKFFDEVILQDSPDYKKLLVSPRFFKDEILRLIDEEIARAEKGKSAYLAIKCNSLTHPEIISKLFVASKAGVKIDLVIRSACGILPNVEGVSDNITLRSIVGDFLEHSRIYSFGLGARRKIIIASCDLMQRNLDHRFEAGVYVENKGIKRKIVSRLNLYLNDNVNARVCDEKGEYVRVQQNEGERVINSQV